MIVSFTEAPLWTQILVFAICSVLSIIFVRPSLLRKLHNRQERLSNSDALIGREGRVIEAICPGDYGYVKIDGDEWKAQSPDDTTIEVGTTVKVIGRESIIISVERVQTSTYNNNQPT
nr:NfeD family protein [Prevotella sp. P4-51]